jgi:hypothetical protein
MRLIFFVLVVIALGLLFRATKGPAYTPNSLGGPIRGLLRQGFNGGVLIIRVGWSRKFVQLCKYIRRPGEYGIELAFPRARWSTTHYSRLRELCDRDAAEFRVSRAGIDDPLEFLFVDFGVDYKKAHAFVQRVLKEVFGVSDNARLFCRLENATPADTLVDR